MVDVVLSESLFGRLQKHAVPLVDSIEDVVARILDAFENSGEGDRGVSRGPDSGPKVFDPSSPPSLMHTVPRQIAVGGVEINKERYWNTLLAEVIRAAVSKGAEASKILNVIQTPAQPGKHVGPGFRYLDEAKLSFQQLNSDRAWAEAYRLARHFRIPVEVRWIWLEKDKAHMPGGSGRMILSF